LKYTLIILSVFASLVSPAQIKNFMFIGMDRDQLKDTSLWATNGAFRGVQIAYSWKQLEPDKDKYDFSIITEDMRLLQKYGKKLFIQIQDASFSVKWRHTPDYLLNDTVYHGGANKQYEFRNNNEADYSEGGWVTRRWDIAVQKRLHKFYTALGQQFDGIVEGVNTQETAILFGKGPLHPPGFSFERYRDAVNENILALRNAFPKSTVIVYANFMPGGYIPGEDSTLLKSVYEFAWNNKIGVGGPDLFPYKRGQMRNSYRLIKESHGKVASGVAVQDGNYQYSNPQTNKTITAEEIYRFAKGYLQLNYIFWGTEDPFFHKETLPFLKTLR
jgi:hypothetical protein